MKRQINLLHCLIFILLAVEMLVLSGCNNTRESDAVDVGTAVPVRVTDTIAVPTATAQQIQPVETQAIIVPTSPPQGYPAPETLATVAPTQNSVGYPPPVIDTQPVASSTLTPTSPPAENLANDPYPAQDTPIAQPQGLSNPSPYPPPPEGVQAVPSEMPVPSSQPVETGVVPTAQVPIVRTRLVATDPALVDLEAGRPQLVLFFADWCQLCKSLAPVVLSLDSQYNNQMNFIYLNVDDPATDSLKTSLNYQIIARPRLYLLDAQGAILREWTGYVPREELQEAINAIGVISP